MSFYATAIIAASTLYSTHQAKRRQKEGRKAAKEDQLEAEKQARGAEVFSETEGEGVGNIGNISLEVDREIDEDEETNTSVRI